MALVGLYSGVYLSLAIFLITGFVRTIPRELEEAAQIDGASRWRVFWRVIFPLLSPVLFAAGILLWVYVWNDFFYAFFLLNGAGRQTLPLGLFSVVSSNSHSTNWNYVFADVIVVSLPLVVVFVIGQRRILAGVMAGGVKG
jgi:raffinose/stachyose/melibiose transport system permease protein